MRCGLCARVSTTAGQSCENQLLELRRYVEARGWTATEYVDEGVSGAKDRRPERTKKLVALGGVGFPLRELTPKMGTLFHVKCRDARVLQGSGPIGLELSPLAFCRDPACNRQHLRIGVTWGAAGVEIGHKQGHGCEVRSGCEQDRTGAYRHPRSIIAAFHDSWVSRISSCVRHTCERTSSRLSGVVPIRMDG